MYRRLGEETAGTMRVALMNLLVDGRGRVVAVHRFTAERQGRRMDEVGCIVFRIVGDKITDLDECIEDVDRSNEFWG